MYRTRELKDSPEVMGRSSVGNCGSSCDCLVIPVMMTHARVWRHPGGVPPQK